MNSYSQFGEDEIIAQILLEIEPRNHWCFEVGAHNGTYLSNTLAFREAGWTAILAESNPRHYVDLDAQYGKDSHCVLQEVESLDTLLESYEAPYDIDLGVIDVDGLDYWLWHDMTEYRPRILMIEFCPYEKYEWFDPINPAPREHPERQTTRQPTIDLGEKKGYRLEGETFCNLIFVANDADWGN